jgi:hypothetical protein
MTDPWFLSQPRPTDPVGLLVGGAFVAGRPVGADEFRKRGGAVSPGAGPTIYLTDATVWPGGQQVNLDLLAVDAAAVQGWTPTP